jgi:RNA polymerase sigma-70 factor (ECF subfamily)
MVDPRWQPVERDIAAARAAGDLDGAATLALRAYGGALYGYLSVVLGDDDAAEEVFARVGEELWRDLPGFRGDSALRTWLYRVAWHAALRYRREPWRRRAVAAGSDVLSRVVAEVRSSTASWRRTSARDRLERLRRALTPDEQSLLTLRIDQGLAWGDIAAVMASPEVPVDEAALRKRFERLKAKVRRLARADRAS